jgi:hypothetical protein
VVLNVKRTSNIGTAKRQMLAIAYIWKELIQTAESMKSETNLGKSPHDGVAVERHLNHQRTTKSKLIHYPLMYLFFSTLI